MKDLSGRRRLEDLKDLDKIIEGFKRNIQNGWPSQIKFAGKAITLTCDHPNGFIGLVTVEIKED